jgi:hypothetical protein
VREGGSNRSPAPRRPCRTSRLTSLPPLAKDAVSPILVEAVTFGKAAIVLAYVATTGSALVPTSGVRKGPATRGEPDRQQLPDDRARITIVNAPPVIPAL